MYPGFRCLPACLLLFLLAGDVSARPDRPAPVDRLLDTLFQVRTYSEVALSPDGKQVAWVESIPGEKHAASSHTAIHVARLDAAAEKPRRLTAGKADRFHKESGLAWSPDGRRLVFLSDQEKAG